MPISVSGLLLQNENENAINSKTMEAEQGVPTEHD